MRIFISIILSLLLIIGAILHTNNEYTVPKTWQSLFKFSEEVENKKNKRKKR